jgi:hypothetical protein
MQALIKFFNRWYVCVPVVTFAATLALVCGSNVLSLHAFGTTSLIGVLSLSAVLSVAALVLLVVIGIIVLSPLRLSSPGMLLQTALGIASGSLAIWLVGLALPKAILLHGLVAAVPYATANTMTIWVLSYATGGLKKLNLLPKRQST